MKKRVLSWILVLSLCVTLLPTSVSAQETGDSTSVVTETTDASDSSLEDDSDSTDGSGSAGSTADSSGSSSADSSDSSSGSGTEGSTESQSGETTVSSSSGSGTVEADDTDGTSGDGTAAVSSTDDSDGTGDSDGTDDTDSTDGTDGSDNSAGDTDDSDGTDDVDSTDGTDDSDNSAGDTDDSDSTDGTDDSDGTDDADSTDGTDDSDDTDDADDDADGDADEDAESEIIDSGEFTNSESSRITWTLTEDGLLTISGYGSMEGATFVEDLLDETLVYSVVFEEGITDINEYKFRYFTNLTTVEIASTIETIDMWAFTGCTALTTVTGCEGLTFVGEHSFQGCTNLTEIEIPEDCELGGEAFRGCESLADEDGFVMINSWLVDVTGDAASGTQVELPDSAVYIGQYALSNCQAAETIVLGASAANIQNAAFSDCGSLSAFAVSSGNIALTAVDGVLFTADMTTLVSYPLNKSGSSYTVPDGVTAIAAYAFCGACNLEEIILPDTVTEVGDWAFACSALTSVVDTGDAVLGERIYYCCQNLYDSDGWLIADGVLYNYSGSETDITIPDGVTKISEGVFGGAGLTSVTFPDTLTYIGYQAFYGNSELTTLVIPDSVTYIGDDAFYGCTSVTSLTLGESLEEIGVRAFCSISITELVIPDSVTTIDDSAFENCTSLAQLTLGSGLTSIGEAAFISSAITSVVIPDGVTRIEGSTFESCTQLVDVEMGDDVTYIGGMAFWSCAFSSITLPEALETIGGNAFGENTNLEKVIFTGDNLTTIEKYAFLNTGVTSIEIPESVEYIGDNILFNAPVSEVVFAGTDPAVTHIGDYAFNPNYSVDAQAVTLLTYEEVEIGEAAFYGEAQFTCLKDTPVAETLQNLGYSVTEVGDALTVTVQNEDGETLTDGFTVYWYKEGGTSSIGTGSSLTVTDTSVVYDFEIVLDDDLGLTYYAPDRASTTAGETEYTVTLESVTELTVSGTVTDKNGDVPDGVTVTFTSTVNDGISTEVTAQPDADGTFSASVPDGAITAVFTADAYYTRTCVVQSERSGEESVSMGTVILYALPSSKVDMTITRQEAALDGEDAESTELLSSQLSGYTFTLTDADGEEISDVTREGLTLYFDDDTVVEAGETIYLQASCRDESAAAELVEITLDDSKVGSAAVTFVENGSFLAEDLTGATPAYIYVFDESGALADSGLYTTSWQSEPLPDGTYEIVIMENVSWLSTVTRISILDAYGLEEGTDYVKLSASVTNGVVTALESVEVPELDSTGADVLDGDNTSVTVNKTSVTVGSLVSLRVSYAVSDDYSGDPENMSLNLVLPDGLDYISGSSTLGGVVTEAEYDTDSSTLSVPLADTSGSFRCLIMATEAGDYTLSPYFSFTSDGVSLAQTFGSVDITSPELTITVPDRTGNSTITVRGSAYSGSTVKIYDSDTLIGTATANSAGTWSASVDLYKPYTHTTHYIYAVIDTSYGYTVQTDTETVIYDVSYLDVKQVIMYNFAHEQVTTVWSFSGESSTNGTYDYNSEYPEFTFVVEMDTDDPDTVAESVPTMYVITTGLYGDDTYVTVTYDADLQGWVGSAEYDFDTMPCELTVSYDQPGDTNDAVIDWEEIADTVSEQAEYWESLGVDFSDYYDVEVSEDTEDCGSWIFTPLDETSELPVMSLVFEMVEAGEVSDLEFAELSDTDGETFAFCYEYTGDTYRCVLQVDEDSYLTMTLSAEAQDGSSEISTLAVTEPSDLLNQALSYLTLGFSDQAQLVQDVNKMFDEVSKNKNKFYIKVADTSDELIAAYCRPCLTSELLAFYDELNALQQRYEEAVEEQKQLILAYNITQALLNGLGAVPQLKAAKAAKKAGEGSLKILQAAFNKMGLLEALADKLKLQESDLPGLLCALNKDMIDISRNQMQKSFEEEIDELRSRIPRCECSNCECENHRETTWESTPTKGNTNKTSDSSKKPMPDPSGYVYEAVPSNRLEGVTASIYEYVVTYDDAGDEIVSAEWVLWDAESYDEVQNQLTNADGEYGWDVTTGTWKVKYVKDGYETACSDEMEVPPEWTEVNIGLVSEDAPEVESVVAYTDGIDITFSQYMVPDTVTNAVTVTIGGETVSGTVTAQNEEDNYDGTASYASEYLFTPDTDTALIAGAAVTLSIAATAESYNGQTLGSAAEEESTVKSRIEGITLTSDVYLIKGDTQTLTFSLGEAGAGAQAEITVKTSSILKLTDAEDGTLTVTADADGNFSVDVTGKLPGSGVLLITLADYNLSAEQAVTIHASATDISDATVTFEACTYDGTAQEPAAEVTLSDGTVLSEDNYTVTYANNTNAGTATAVITAAGNGQYTGSVETTFTIAAKSISGATVSLAASSYTYDGSAKTPGVSSVKVDGTTLTSGTDYSVTYASGRTNVGTYKVTVTGTGNYTGTVSASFKITAQSLSSSNVSLSASSYTYNGSAKTPTVTVKNSAGTTLTKGTHYSVTYASGRTNVGTYKVTVTGSGNYTGTVTVSFKITAQSLSSSKISLSKSSYTYSGSAKTPSVTVKNSAGSKLTKNTDFTVSYASGRKNVGTYKVTITGKGNYTGTVTKSFKITKASKSITVKNSYSSKSKAKSYKYTTVKKAKKTFKALTVSNKKSRTVTYKKVSGSSKLSVNTKTGKITVKKGTKKGTYKIKIKVTAAASANYTKSTKTVTVYVKVK